MKIMAIDYGDAHTGIAISDATGTLAGFTTVIDSRKAEVVVQEILRLLPEHGVTELVLGYPKNMDGTVGPRAEKAAAFAETLRQAADLPVTLWDERRTTIDAHHILYNADKNVLYWGEAGYQNCLDYTKMNEEMQAHKEEILKGYKETAKKKVVSRVWRDATFFP